MRRFAITPDGIQGDRVAFDRAESRHLSRVLRLRPGDTVVAVDGTGRDYTVRLETVGDAQVTGTLLGVAARDVESPLAITLVQGVPKGDKMERIIRAATELGVVRVLPAIAERTIVRLDGGRWRERARRWQRVAREAGKQCGRALVPAVEPPRPLAEWLELASPGGPPASLRLGLWEGSDAPRLGRVLEAFGATPTAAAVLVGPEGGLTRGEVERATRLGWLVASLGPRVLRTETAGPAIVAILQSRFGDLG